MLRSWIALAGLLLISDPLPGIAQTSPPVIGFETELQTIHRQLNPDFCWFHPRIAAIPGAQPGDSVRLICTLQKHLRASDHYSGLYIMRSENLGRTWTAPQLPPALDWKTENGETIAVCDVTPGWHAPSGRLLAIGTKLRYSQSGEQRLDQPRSHQCAWTAWDPQQDQWTPWQMLELPDETGRHYLAAAGCVQWLVRPDGDLLLPLYIRGPAGEDYSAAVYRCRFDGQKLRLISEGRVLSTPGGRGFAEPSLAFFQGQYFLTLRNDSGGFVAVSQDGLQFSEPRPWKFDDGSDLGSYNTQQHWLVHDRGLFLCYTRRGLSNDHIPRHRAPLLIAQVDPATLTVLRSTEQVLIPERGVMLGNFGAATVTAEESWVTDAEYIMADTAHPRGADGSVFAARVRWKEPSQSRTPASKPRIVVLGDSITKGVRGGVTAEDTFGAVLQRQLPEQGLDCEVINRGIGGERTDQALLRLARDVLALEPQLVTVMYGTNDSYVDKGRQESRISADDFDGFLRKIVAELQRCGIQPVLMTEPAWGGTAAFNGAGEHPNKRLSLYMERTRRVASELSLPLVDHYRIWSTAAAAGTDIGAWTTDQCHPNPAGHAKLAEEILPVVKDALMRR
ncbi:MAG: GDSL-type esterase/lipase family protein [Planctomycetota bacterium]